MTGSKALNNTSSLQLIRLSQRCSIRFQDRSQNIHAISLWIVRTPRSFAVSMAGLRQGRGSAAPKGPEHSGGLYRPGFLGSARNGRSPGEETSGCTVAAARGKRRSCPLPTKAIDEAVCERGSGRRAQGVLARIGRCVQCPADAPCPAKLILLACRSRRDILPIVPRMKARRRAGFVLLTVTGPLAQTAGRRGQAPSGLHPAPPRSARLFAGGDWYRHHPVSRCGKPSHCAALKTTKRLRKGIERTASPLSCSGMSSGVKRSA